jgi:hypothetical protein
MKDTKTIIEQAYSAFNETSPFTIWCTSAQSATLHQEGTARDTDHATAISVSFRALRFHADLRRAGRGNANYTEEEYDEHQDERDGSVELGAGGRAASGNLKSRKNLNSSIKCIASLRRPH